MLVSSRNTNLKASFKEALLSPLASDGGLFCPQNLPKIKADNLSYKALAIELAKALEIECLREIEKSIELYSSFDFHSSYHLVKLREKLWLNELYCGPTRAFKDIALCPFAKLLSSISDERVLILCATSGDTGPATLSAFANLENIRVLCLYPKGKTSALQALQMDTQAAKNLLVLAIDGDFDLAQKTVKSLLIDLKDFFKSKNLRLSTANSINFGRIFYQLLYHFHSSMQFDEDIDLIIPSGNFGNALAAYYAKKMGARIRKIKIATNENCVLKDFIQTGIYSLKNRALKATLSPAMDILLSSNLERLVFDLLGAARCKDLYEKLAQSEEFEINSDELALVQEFFEAKSASDSEVLEQIKTMSKTKLIDPHSATAFPLIDESRLNVIAGTAEWTKFAPSMGKALYGRDFDDELELIKKISKDYKSPVKPEILALFGQELHSTSAKASEVEGIVKDWIS